MPSTNELDSVNRILITIKTYCHQITDPNNLLSNEPLQIYLEQHLTPQDWAMWQQLQYEGTKELVLEDQSFLEEFRSLLGQYKRAAYERIHVWSRERHNQSLR